jgi:hypothetical protein
MDMLAAAEIGVGEPGPDDAGADVVGVDMLEAWEPEANDASITNLAADDPLACGIGDDDAGLGDALMDGAGAETIADLVIMPFASRSCELRDLGVDVDGCASAIPSLSSSASMFSLSGTCSEDREKEEQNDLQRIHKTSLLVEGKE